MDALRRRLDAILDRLKGNEREDRGLSSRLDRLEKRVDAAERKIGKRVKTLDADE